MGSSTETDFRKDRGKQPARRLLKGQVEREEGALGAGGFLVWFGTSSGGGSEGKTTTSFPPSSCDTRWLCCFAEGEDWGEKPPGILSLESSQQALFIMLSPISGLRELLVAIPRLALMCPSTLSGHLILDSKVALSTSAILTF